MEIERKCPGCGAILQTTDENKDGYVDERALMREHIVCKRCYQLQHYGKFSKGNDVFNTLKMIHENVNKDDIVVLVGDVSLTYAPFLSHLGELNRYPNLYMIANRYDLFRTFLSQEKALDFLEKQIVLAKLKIQRLYLIDNNVKEVFDELYELHPNKNLCFVGLENAGKTTLINLFLKYYYPEIPLLTKSLYPGTTLQPVKVMLPNNTYLLDTPGIKSAHSFIHHVENAFLKRMQNDRKIMQTAYQLDSKQAIHINNFLSFQYVEGNHQTIIFYTSAMFTLTRTKLENAKASFDSLIANYKLKTNKVKSFNDLTQYDIEIKNDKKQDIVIEGLGFITVAHKGKFKIYTLGNTNITIRDSMI